MLEIQIDTKDFEKKMIGWTEKKMEKQIRYAASVALNETAFDVRKHIGETMVNAFSKTTQTHANFIKKSFNVKKAKKSLLESYVYLREDSAGKGSTFDAVIKHHFTGGDRPLKRFEKALKANGWLYSNQIAVVANAFPGKMTSGLFTKIMSYLKLHYKAGYTGNMTAAGRAKVERRGRTAKGYATIGGKAYFIVPNSHRGKARTRHLRPGIWQKSGIHGSIIHPVILFVSKPNYRKRFDLQDMAEPLAIKRFHIHFDKALEKAIKTAK